MKNPTLRITYLYPHHMNLYGDTGNILCLKKRCEWRNIEVKLTLINPGDTLHPDTTDLYFFGGGQDAQQAFVAQDLQRHKSIIQTEIDNGVVALTICGGYQLFGHRFVTKDHEVIPGIEIFDIETKGSDHRMIGNSIIKLDPNIYAEIAKIYPTNKLLTTNHSLHTLVGFENHSGETFPSSGNTIGTNLLGFGNNYASRQEGFHYKNAFGTYLHGSLLPKNPHFADYLIAKALEHRTKSPVELTTLDDTLEWQAHLQIVSKSQILITKQ